MAGVSFAVMFASFSFCCAVQVFSRGAHGKLAWRTDPTWRDRSAVPTPPAEIMEVNTQRAQVLRPKTILKHTHVSFPVSEKEAIKNQENSKDKRNQIRRIFFSLPIGGQLPVFYSSKSAVHKKSQVISQGEGHPFSENIPEQSINWDVLHRNGGDLKDVALASRTIGRQEPETEDAVFRGLGTITRTKKLGTDAVPYDDVISKKPLQEIYRRSRSMEMRTVREEQSTNSKPLHATNTNERRDPQAVLFKETQDAKKSGLPEGDKRGDSPRPSRNKINKEMENIITKFMVVI